MNSSTPSSPLSGPTHEPSSDSSNARSLSVYKGLRESTGTQPVRHARSAKKTRCFLFMPSIVDQFKSPEIGIQPQRTQRAQRENGFHRGERRDRREKIGS